MAPIVSLEVRDILKAESVTDPDISGPGVIIGFILANTLTVSASFTTLYMRHRERIDPDTSFFGIKARAWSRLLGDFVLALSDQQLLTGLIMLVVGMARYYDSSVRTGANNMWTAADIVIFSSVTHGASMIAARPYFSKHRRRSLFRVGIMWAIYILWLVIAVNILSPIKPPDSKKLSKRQADFWHAATYIEAFGVAWMYFIVIVPLFLSKHAAKVRSAIAQLAPSDEVLHRLEAWEGYVQARRISSTQQVLFWKSANGRFGKWDARVRFFNRNFAPYKALRSRISDRAKRFCRYYIAHDARQTRRMLWIISEIFWPWWSSVILIGLLWTFGFAIMIVNMVQNGISGGWGFGQLLSPALILLPIYGLVVAIIDARHSTSTEQVQRNLQNSSI